MMLHLQDPPIVHHGPGPDSPPVRPPRNPARLSIQGGGELTLSPPTLLKPMTAPWDDRREGRRITDSDVPPVNVPPAKPLDNKKRLARTTSLPPITTLNRKILKQLRRSMFARSAQFTLKNNVKHHAFPPDKVPYPRSYDHKCIDTDVWETVFCEQFSGNVTFHTFDVPPTKVLDLGCGSGAWIMACARRWKNCHFVGLDVVPLHPDLGKSELGQRVNWIQANFLEQLPFPNEEFDFVHVKRIARGVPENKWDALFQEIIRVMKPGAVLEMLEEDLYIPGQMMEIADNDSLPSTASSYGSSEELGQPYSPSIQGHSTALSDTPTGQNYPISQMSRRSSSDRHSARSSVGSTKRYNRSTPPSPQNTRPFPLLKPKPSSPTVRPIASHFNLQNLLSKRSGRNDGTGKIGGRPRKNEDSPVPVPSGEGTRLRSASVTSALPGRYHPAQEMHRPPLPDVILSPPAPHPTVTGTSTDLMLETRASMDLLSSFPVPPQVPEESDESDPPLTLPPMENTNGRLEVDFQRDRQNGDPRLARARSFSCPTQEDDGYWISTSSLDLAQFGLSTFEVYDQNQLIHSSGIRDSPTLPDEPIESNRQDKKITVVPPPFPPPRDIPDRRRPRAIRYTHSSSDLSSITATGLSRSVPESVIEQRHRNGNQLLSPTVGSSKPTRSSSTPSLAINISHPTEQVPPLPRNDHSSDGSGADNFIHSPKLEIPPNPRHHKLLEVIYAEMHAARVVNLAPLSLLENYIRTYFKNVSAHTPLTFTFPPPSGCKHRPEFDAAELQRRNPIRAQRTEDCDDQDRYLGPDTTPSFSQPTSPKSISPRHTRESTQSVTSNYPGPSSARPSSIQPSRPSIANPETADHRKPRSRGSRPHVGHGNRTVPDWTFVTGDEPFIGTREHASTNTPVVGGLPPARVARAAQKSASSASDERESPRQRSDSLFTRSNDTNGKGEGGEARKMLHALVTDFTPPSTASSLPPSSCFEYKNSNAVSSTSLYSFMTSSSTSTIIQHDYRKGQPGLTPAGRPQSSALPAEKTEVDVRSLGLHLRARMVEIIGCSEAMWDWVKEFQDREEKERKRKEKLALAAAKKNLQGVGGGRVSYYHRDRARTVVRPERKNSAENDQPTLHRKRSARSLSSIVTRNKRGNNGFVKWDDPSGRMEKSVKQELLLMTRDRFDQMLSWFKFDMDDSILLTRSMATRIPSSIFEADLTEQRKSFDVACQKLATYLQQHPETPISPVKPHSIISKSSQSSHRSEEELCCLPPLLGLVHPSKRLCRTIRVWVAWKP